MQLNLSSKAKTLQDLKEIISEAEVLPILCFGALDYSLQKEDILDQCIKQFNTNLVVRSSSSNEDNIDSSSAGKFNSILDVLLNKKKIHKAIMQVIDSYETLCSEDEVFIQPMLSDVTMSGVVFTADIDTLAPYYIVNYDTSGSTTKVTAGTSNDLKTFVAYKKNLSIKDEKLRLLLKVSKKCKEIFNNSSLDIEFAFSKNKLYILQVRAIATTNKTNLNHVDLNISLRKLYKKIQKLNITHPKLLGKKTIFGMMPDWNPAEIIGTKPKRLALSLYKELVTDKVWAYQRDNYGYRNLRSFPLLVSFLGVPFIDVRISFNSFIPKNLNENIASKLVDFYIQKLSDNKNYHDKIEFKIVYSCYFFGISKKLEKLQENGFSKNEIKHFEFSLLEITNNIIDTKNGLYKKDILKIEKLKSNYDAVVNSSLSLVDKIYWLTEDCKRYGTLPFAGVARAAFVAVQFLNSMVEQDVISSNEYDEFLNSLNTVSKQLSKDRNLLSKDDFLNIYGHLRPGTYDITSKRYDEDYENYFSQETNDKESKEFVFSDTKKEYVQQLLDESGINSNAEDFLQFLKEAIEKREYLKFVFTKHLSKILLCIEELGSKHHISRSDLAYLDIQKVLSLYSTLDHRDVKNILGADIEKNKDFFQYTKAIKLPSVLVSENDLYSFYLQKEEANFITQKSTQAFVIDLEKSLEKELRGKIVCIESADPGYDYLFTKDIVGLITCYGGANSHMAIRCAELGIPAVIGCGESNFIAYKKANILAIDALNRQVKVIS